MRFEETVHIAAKVPEHLADKLEKMAQEQFTSKSAIIRQLIEHAKYPLSKPPQ